MTAPLPLRAPRRPSADTLRLMAVRQIANARLDRRRHIALALRVAAVVVAVVVMVAHLG